MGVLIAVGTVWVLAEKTGAKAEILTEGLLKIQVFWDVTLCRWTSSSRRFQGSWSLRLRAEQSKKNKRPTE